MCKTARSSSPLFPPQRNLHFCLDDIGVYLGNSVDGVGPHDTKVGHVHPLASLLLNQRHLPQLVHVIWIESCDSLQAAQNESTGQGVGGSWWLGLR